MSTFYMPTRVFSEENAVIRHAKDIASFGKKALIVTGKHSAFANGSYDDLVSALQSEGLRHVVFSEVEENPSVTTIMKARDFGLENSVDFVIGIGGGSPLDASKAISLMIAMADKDKSYLYAPDCPGKTLPIVAIPTTCGTGSEVTAVSVITDREKMVKKSIAHKIFPDLALIDGRYLAGAPLSVLSNTAFDALTHLIESFLNSHATEFSRMCVDAGLRMWAKSLPVLRKMETPDAADFENMMLASTMAGMSIAHTATTIPHGLSYAVTTYLGVPHGKATAYFTAGYLCEASEEDRNYLIKTADFASVEDFRAVYREACGTIDAPEAELKSVLKTAVDELSGNPAKMALAPFPIDREALERIAFYELSHSM